MEPPNNIRFVREGRGLTQAALAEMVGTSQSQIDRLEKGTRKLSFEWMKRLADGLQTSVGALLGTEPTDEFFPFPLSQNIPTSGETVAISATIPHRDDWRFVLTSTKVSNLPLPVGLTDRSATIKAFHMPNNSLNPRWFRGEIVYIQTDKNFLDCGHIDEWPERHGSEHYIVNLIDSQSVCGRIWQEDGDSYEMLSYNRGEPKNDRRRITKPFISSIHRLVEWEELLYGARHIEIFMKIPD